MRIALTSTGTTLESEVDPRFGRAARFIIFDTVNGAFEVIDPQSQMAAQGAGIQAAETLSRLGVECVLTGHCGPKAFQTLTAAGIQVCIGVEGTVAAAVERFRAGELQANAQPDVAGHWV